MTWLSSGADADRLRATLAAAVREREAIAWRVVATETALEIAQAALADRDATIARQREAVEAAVIELDHIASAGAPRPPGGQQVGPGVYQMTLSTSQAIKRALHELTRRTLATADAREGGRP
jgi:hypothetical protein